MTLVSFVRPSAVTAIQALKVPPLPSLALDTYPPAARDQIAKAHAQASGHPDDADAVGTLARTLQAWEQWDAAHQSYLRAQGLAPRAFEWHYLDAIVLQRVAHPADAAAQLRDALAIAPDYLPARVKLAEALLDAGQLEESRTLFSAIHDPAAEPSVEFGLGRIEAATGHHEAAIPHFQKAIALYPEFGSAHYALALSYRALGRRDEARTELEAHAKHGAKWPAIPDSVLASVTALRDDAGALLQRGVKLANDGEIDEAIAAHEAALTKNPSLVQAHANLISLYGRKGDFAKAQEHYRAVVDSGLDLADAHYDYGVLLGMQQKWDDAAEAYRRALALNPLHARARNNLGQVLERQQKYEEAAAEYQRAVEAEPTLRVARFNYARMLMAVGRNEEAVTELRQLTDPRDAEAPRYLFALSAAYLRSGHKDDAIKWATDARQLALQFGDTELAAAIERNLATIR